MCNRSLKQTAISLSSCEAEFYADRVCAGENFWESQNSSRNCTTTFQFVSKWIQTRQDTFHSASDQADSNISKHDALQHNSGYERNVCRCVERTRRTTLEISSRNIRMDCEQHWLAKELGLRILDGTNGKNGDD